MSGRRQHYLPQFLQRRFAHRASGGQSYVYVHGVDHHFCSSTTGVGVERDFYSGPEDTTADDVITLAEEGPASTLRDICTSRSISTVSEVAAVFSLLSIRTLKMREAMRSLVPLFVEGVRRLGAQDELTNGIIHRKIHDRKWLNKHIDQLAKQSGITDRNKIAVARTYLRPRLEAELESRKIEFSNQLNHILSIVLGQLESESQALADSAFANLFTSRESLTRRDSMFSNFSYRLIESGSSEVILGDCAVVASDDNGEPCLALADSDETSRLACVYLPVSPNLLIFGSRSASATPLGIAELNSLSASLSSRFFISYSPADHQTEKLRSKIGTMAGLNFDLEQVMVGVRAP